MKLRAHFIEVISVAALVMALNACTSGQRGSGLKDDSSRILELKDRETPISATDGLRDLLTEPKKRGATERHLAPSEAYAECADVKEIPETSICIFNQMNFMNIALVRATTFIEGSGATAVPRGTMFSDKELVRTPSLDMIGGHDLQGPALAAYWTAYQKAAPSFAKPAADDDAESDDGALLHIENDFWQTYLLPKLERERNLVLIAASADGDVKGVITHEVMHAQYFHSKDFQDVVFSFWQHEVSSEDKEGIKKALAQYYDVTDEKLLMNEFQAYILMNNADAYELYNFVSKYRETLMDSLKVKGVVPVQARL